MCEVVHRDRRTDNYIAECHLLRCILLCLFELNEL